MKNWKKKFLKFQPNFRVESHKAETESHKAETERIESHTEKMESHKAETEKMESHKPEIDKVESKKHYDWYEFTPFEIGCDEYNGKTTFFLSDKKVCQFFTNLYFSFIFFLSAWIPTWAFGREFKSGKSVSRSPEQNISQLLG